jgi:hypothetical protein
MAELLMEAVNISLCLNQTKDLEASLAVPSCKTDSLMRLTPYSVPKQYNELPNFMKNQGTLLLKMNFKLDK